MEASGGTIVDLAHPDDLEQGIAQALEQYSKADHYEITYRMKCKNGSWKYIEDRGHKIRKSDGMIEHWNLILERKSDLLWFAFFSLSRAMVFSTSSFWSRIRFQPS